MKLKHVFCMEIFVLVAGCAAVESATADATYGGQLGSCIDRNSTRSAIDACRQAVNVAWCVDDAGIPRCTAPDASAVVTLPTTDAGANSQ